MTVSEILDDWDDKSLGKKKTSCKLCKLLIVSFVAEWAAMSSVIVRV